MKISQYIEERKKAFSEPIELEDNVFFDHRETIKRINLYQNNKFVECNDGNAIFWNLAAPHVPHFAKNIDLDTKNFKVEGKGDANSIQAWILNMNFVLWARLHGFAITLNDLFESVSIYGTTVWKLVADGKKHIEECDLKRLYYDPSVKNINDSDIIEVHELTEAQVKKHYPDINFEEFKRVAAKQITSIGRSNTAKYIIHEFSGWFDDKETHQIVAGSGENEMVLHKEAKKEIYFDFHLSRYRNRHLRIGIYERLFALQERMNTLVNQNAETTAIASLLLLRTTDPNTTGNVLQGAISGQIINSADLEQIGIDNRFLNNFLQEMALIEAQAVKLCLTPEVITGEKMPSHTPFRSVAVLTSAARSAFKNTRDRLGLKITQILIDEILPDQVKSWNRGEIIEIADNEADIIAYDRAVVKWRMADWLKKRMASGNNPSEDEKENFRQNILNSLEEGGRKLEIKKGFFNFKYGLIINPTGETADRETQNDVSFNALQMIQMNPAIVNNPIFRQYAERNGLPAFKFTPEEVAQYAQSNVGGFQPVGGEKKDKLMAMADPK